MFGLLLLVKTNVSNLIRKSLNLAPAIASSLILGELSCGF